MIYQASFYKSIKEKNNTILDLNKVLFLKDKRAITMIDNIRNCSEKDRGEKKRKLPAFTPVATFDFGHQASNLIHYNNLLQFDIDAKDNDNMTPTQMREKILNSDLSKYIYYCALSCSAAGIWGLVRVNGTIDDYKAHFEAFSNDLKAISISSDNSCSDLSRLRFISYDNSPYFNADSEIYTQTVNHTINPVKPRKQQVYSPYVSHTPTFSKATDTIKMNNMIEDIQQSHIILTHSHQESNQIISALVNTFGQSGLEYWLTIRSQRQPYNEDKQTLSYQSTLKRYCNGNYIGNYSLGLIINKYKQERGTYE